MLPVEIQHQAGRAAGDHMGTDKVRVLRNDGTRVPIRELDNVAVWCAVAGRKIQGVDSVVPRRDQAPRETPRQHRVEEESHAAGR